MSARPAWWGPQDDADRNSAFWGCRTPERNCLECLTPRCPQERRVCRVCDMWRSDDGAAGVCGADASPCCGKAIPGRGACGAWRARREG